MFCYKCGKEIDENADFCPECGAALKEEQPIQSTEQPAIKETKVKAKLDPISVIALIFSGIAALFGFLIVSISFARWGGGLAFMDVIVFIPALFGLGVGIYKLLNGEQNKTSKLISIITASLSSFVLIYAFIGILVAII